MTAADSPCKRFRKIESRINKTSRNNLERSALLTTVSETVKSPASHNAQQIGNSALLRLPQILFVDATQLVCNCLD